MRQSMVVRRKSQSYKRKLEKRRRTRRNQKGGANSDTASNITEWVQRAKADIDTKTAELTPDYKISSFKSAALTLPAGDTTNFVLVPSSTDVRIHGAIIRDIIASVNPDVAIDDITPTLFGGIVELLDADQRDELLNIENQIRSYAEVPSIESLTSSGVSTLYLWVLIVNLPADIRSVPSFIPAGSEATTSSD